MLALIEITPWHWVGFIVSIVFFLALDLGFFHKGAHVVSIKEALIWTIVWITMAVLFGAALWWTRGRHESVQFFTGYFIEDGETGFDVVAASLGDLAVEVVLAAESRARGRKRCVGGYDHRERIPLDQLAWEEAHPDCGVRRATVGEDVESTFLHVKMKVEEDKEPRLAHDFQTSDWATWNGTSFASPKITGHLAARLSLSSTLTAEVAWNALKQVSLTGGPGLGVGQYVFDF
jgi:hypothetical protein